MMDPAALLIAVELCLDRGRIYRVRYEGEEARLEVPGGGRVVYDGRPFLTVAAGQYRLTFRGDADVTLEELPTVNGPGYPRAIGGCPNV